MIRQRWKRDRLPQSLWGSHYHGEKYEYVLHCPWPFISLLLNTFHFSICFPILKFNSSQHLQITLSGRFRLCNVSAAIYLFSTHLLKYVDTLSGEKQKYMLRALEESFKVVSDVDNKIVMVQKTCPRFFDTSTPPPFDFWGVHDSFSQKSTAEELFWVLQSCVIKINTTTLFAGTSMLETVSPTQEALRLPYCKEVCTMRKGHTGNPVVVSQLRS